MKKMKIDIIEIKEFVLTLNEDEACWLMAVFQNPLAESESVRDKEMREKYFNILHRELRPIV